MLLHYDKIFVMGTQRIGQNSKMMNQFSHAMRYMDAMLLFSNNTE
jgi:hypothetical protein